MRLKRNLVELVGYERSGGFYRQDGCRMRDAGVIGWRTGFVLFVVA